MAFVQFSRVSLAFADRDILKDVSLNLTAGTRASLAGANGSGKSTLLKVIAGKLPPDSGDRAVQKGTRISYLPQSGIVHQGKTLRDEAETAYEPITAMIRRMEETGLELAGVKEDDGRTAGLLDEYHGLQEAIERSGYYRREAVIASVLSGLGFSKKDPGRNTEEFSGGWQMRIALAKVLLEDPDILLLDEPTNYLDIEARSWLEEWLGNFRGGCLLVSHDRYFLDVTVNEVYEIFQGNLKRYAGNYTSYEKTRGRELESLLKRWAEQQEETAKSEELIRRFRYKAAKAAMVQERIKKLGKMEKIEIPETLKKISITFPPPPRSGRVALTLEGLGKSYGGRGVFSGLDLVLESGERLVVAGRNGAGKSTLLRIIAGADTDYEGKVTCGAGIVPGYFSQESSEITETPGGPAAGSVLEFLEAGSPPALVPRLRDMLGAFLFRGDDVYKPLSVLSGGEKSRLALLKILLKPVNLLVLDEPTNHLDLHSKDILLDALKHFTGTVIFVSHDRSFMETLSTRTLELRGGETAAPSVPRLFYGNYAYYLERIEREASCPGNAAGASGPVNASINANTNANTAPEKPAAEKPPKTILVKAADTKAPAPGSAAYREQEKQRQTIIRRIERQEAEILKALENLEKEKSRLEAELSLPEVYGSREKAKAVKLRLDKTAAAIDGKTREWEERAAELENAKREGAGAAHVPEVSR
ncbi:MAG: ABC-F family ATP-binding cassette domain-containing protein [Treponema sp.]|jgi:ATP-binding cassette subfamily F protein 3|nr:ABC-F family ATP-binding cassette domain-containing protein [Treponema sp.]